jgi:hypothetical protein
MANRKLHFRADASNQQSRPKEFVIGRSTVCFGLLLWSVVVVGCSGNQTSYETVYLRNPATGQVVACGPYKAAATGSAAPSNAEQSCIVDYQRQGFVTVPVSE